MATASKDSSKGLSKVSILVLDGSKAKTHLTAQFNPRDINFSKSVSWSDDGPGYGVDYPSLFFTTGSAITMSLELLFDNYETGKDVRPTVQDFISLCMIDKKIHRPPKVQLCWSGTDVLGIGKAFAGVVTEASAKYTMFKSDGTPVRATVSVSMKQADQVGYQTAGANNETKKIYNGITSDDVINDKPKGSKKAGYALASQKGLDLSKPEDKEKFDKVLATEGLEVPPQDEKQSEEG